MPLYQPKIPVCVAIGCSGVAYGFQIAAVAGTGWMLISSLISIKIELFCTEDNCSWAKEGWLKACQAFSMLAAGTILGSFVVGILHIFREDSKRLTLLAVVLCAAAVVCVAVEVGVFADKTKSIINNSVITISYWYGFYLSIAAGVLSVVAAILHVVGRVIIR